MGQAIAERPPLNSGVLFHQEDSVSRPSLMGRKTEEPPRISAAGRSSSACSFERPRLRAVDESSDDAFNWRDYEAVLAKITPRPFTPSSTVAPEIPLSVTGTSSSFTSKCALALQDPGAPEYHCFAMAPPPSGEDKPSVEDLKGNSFPDMPHSCADASEASVVVGSLSGRDARQWQGGPSNSELKDASSSRNAMKNKLKQTWSLRWFRDPPQGGEGDKTSFAGGETESAQEDDKGVVITARKETDQWEAYLEGSANDREVGGLARRVSMSALDARRHSLSSSTSGAPNGASERRSGNFERPLLLHFGKPLRTSSEIDRESAEKARKGVVSSISISKGPDWSRVVQDPETGTHAFLPWAGPDQRGAQYAAPAFNIEHAAAQSRRQSFVMCMRGQTAEGLSATDQKRRRSFASLEPGEVAKGPWQGRQIMKWSDVGFGNAAAARFAASKGANQASSGGNGGEGVGEHGKKRRSRQLFGDLMAKVSGSMRPGGRGSFLDKLALHRRVQATE